MNFGQWAGMDAEKRKLGSFAYERFEGHSAILGQTVHWGRAIPEGVSPEDVKGSVYVLHGGNGDDLQTTQLGVLESLPAELVAQFAERRLQFVFPWVGTSFARTAGAADDQDWSGYFWQEIVPAAEGERQHRLRWISGYSMGGQSALNLFFRAVDRFQGVSSHFGTLIDFDYSSDEAAREFAARNRVSDPYLGVLRDGFTAAFRNRSHFLAHDPITLVRDLDPSVLVGKTVLFDVGSDDEFGLAEGARTLSRVLSERGVQHDFVEVPDGHHDGAFVQQRFASRLAMLLAPANAVSGQASARGAEKSRDLHA